MMWRKPGRNVGQHENDSTRKKKRKRVARMNEATLHKHCICDHENKASFIMLPLHPNTTVLHTLT